MVEGNGGHRGIHVKLRKTKQGSMVGGDVLCVPECWQPWCRVRGHPRVESCLDLCSFCARTQRATNDPW